MESLLKMTFDNEAESYDISTQYLLLNYEYTLEQVASTIPFNKKERFYILDLGCGTGNLIQIIRKQFPNAVIFALDFSEDMIKVAKNKKIDDIHYIIQNMFEINGITSDQLPYFDVIVSSFVFHNFVCLDEHKKILSIINKLLTVNGIFILADLIDFEDQFKKNKIRERLVDSMRMHNLSNDEIIRWLGILEIEDSPLSLSKNVELLKECCFNNISIRTFDNDHAIFCAKKKLDIIQLKSELLILGLKSNEFSKQLYLEQNPCNVWKTGNNGIFISLNDLDVLISINHKANRTSPYEIIENDGMILLTKFGKPLDVRVEPHKYPNWFFEKVPGTEKNFSDYFVLEGKKYLHLAYKRCSFSKHDKCKFCSTERLTSNGDRDVNEICSALKNTLDKIPDNIHFCLGGGTYFPLEKNVAFFKIIIECIRKIKPNVPIWVEMLPPTLEQIDQLIDSGATAFGFNIEIWDDDLRQIICPGKSRISKEYYIEACKHTIKRLGPNKVGSCVIVGLDSYKSIEIAINELIANGIEPCVLPFKSYNKTNLGAYSVPISYMRDFYELSYYAAKASKENGVIFNDNHGCLKCSCCTIMHDFQRLYEKALLYKEDNL